MAARTKPLKPASASAVMTAYEIEREERIKRNNAVMGELPPTVRCCFESESQNHSLACLMCLSNFFRKSRNALRGQKTSIWSTALSSVRPENLAIVTASMGIMEQKTLFEAAFRVVKKASFNQVCCLLA